MTEPPLGTWVVDAFKPFKKKIVSCDVCSEAFAGGDLRGTWTSLESIEDAVPAAFHLRCIPQAAAEGRCRRLDGRNINRSTGLNKAQQEELRAAKNAGSEEQLTTPEKVASKDDCESASSTKAPNKSEAAEKESAAPEKSQPIEAKAAPKAKKVKKVPESEPAAKKAKKSEGGDAVEGKDASGTAYEEFKPAATLPDTKSGKEKHVQGLIPANSYLPIKDFVRAVKPSGTAREVFEGEVCKALPKVSKYIPWLSTEAQKVATGIIENGKHGSLSPQHVYAVVLYTMDVRMAGGDLENNFYYNLNPALQSRSADVLHKIEGYLHYLMGALEALPKEPERMYYRGVPKSAFDLVKKNYTTGKRIHWSGISSISDSEQVSLEFALAEGPAKSNAGPVVFNITARSGRTIRHLSAIPCENEVLLLPNFKGFVTKGVYRKGKVYRVDILEEAEEAAFIF